MIDMIGGYRIVGRIIELDQVEQIRIQQLMWIQQLMIQQLIWSDSETNVVGFSNLSDSETNEVNSETNGSDTKGVRFRD